MPALKCWLKFFYDNGESAEKTRETAGISYKNKAVTGICQQFGSGYRQFLEKS